MLRFFFVRCLFAFSLFSGAISVALADGSVALAWDASSSAEVVAYRVLYGPASGQQTDSVDVGLATSAVISQLPSGQNYFFAVIAYDANGNESLPSNEVSDTVPGTPPLPTPTPSATPTPSPSPNATPIPTPTPTPVPTPVPGVNFSVSKTEINPGDSVIVSISGGPAEALDLVNLFAVGNEFALDGYFLNGSKNPPLTGLSSSTLQFVIRTPGQFFFRFYSHGEVIAMSQTVTVGSVSPIPTPAPSATPTPTASPTPAATPTPTVRPSSTPTPTPTATPTPAPALARMLNVSTRANVQTGDNVLIGGIIIGGDVPKKVAMRGIGPSLTAAGVSGALTNPVISLYDSGGTLIASNDNWKSDAAAIQATGLAPTNDAEAAIVADLAPGAYTAILSGAGGTTGVGLFELYDMSQTTGRIANIATRGKVEAGDKVMIGGFIIGGTQAGDVVVRAIGPSLASAGITGALADPALELYNGNGSLIFRNDDWRSDQEAQISASGLAPTSDREAAVRATLAPGNYTAIVKSARTNSTGTALVEVYNLEK